MLSKIFQRYDKNHFSFYDIIDSATRPVYYYEQYQQREHSSVRALLFAHRDPVSTVTDKTTVDSRYLEFQRTL